MSRQIQTIQKAKRRRGSFENVLMICRNRGKKRSAKSTLTCRGGLVTTRLSTNGGTELIASLAMAASDGRSGLSGRRNQEIGGSLTTMVAYKACGSAPRRATIWC